jgi:Nitroreductase family
VADGAELPGVDELWRELLDDARWAPSPHNTQPWRLRVIAEREAELLYDPARLLPNTDADGRFMTATFGIFVEAIVVAAAARGHDLAVGYDGHSWILTRQPRRSSRRCASSRIRATTRSGASSWRRVARRGGPTTAVRSTTACSRSCASWPPTTDTGLPGAANQSWLGRRSRSTSRRCSQT